MADLEYELVEVEIEAFAAGEWHHVGARSPKVLGGWLWDLVEQLGVGRAATVPYLGAVLRDGTISPVRIVGRWKVASDG